MRAPRDLNLTTKDALQQAPPHQQLPALVAALVQLLITKGVFTEVEWLEAQRLELNENVARSRDREARRPPRPGDEPR